jgi:hypothetical protein
MERSGYRVSDDAIPARRVAVFDAMLEAASPEDKSTLLALAQDVADRVRNLAVRRGKRMPQFGLTSAKELIVALCEM